MVVACMKLRMPSLGYARAHLGAGDRHLHACLASSAVSIERPATPSEPTDAVPAFHLDRLARPFRQQQVPADGAHSAQTAKARGKIAYDHEQQSARANLSVEYMEAPIFSRNPRQLANHIKAQWQRAASAAARQDFDHVAAYLAHMSQLCHQLDNGLDHMHMNALFHGTAKVWLTAMDSCHQQVIQQQLRQHLVAFLLPAVMHLRRVLPEVDARGVSSMFWSFAKMQVNPNTLVPGTLDGLAQQFVEDIDSANDQSHATLLLACVHLKVNPCKGALLQAILQQVNIMNMRLFSARHLANILYSVAKLPSAQPTAQLLDNLCDGFRVKMHEPSVYRQPNAQDIANFVWALSELKHVPPNSLTSAMISQMLCLCCGLKQQRPNAQGTSNFLYGLANLRLPISPTDAMTLAKHLLQTGSRHKQHNQHLSNTAWSLAAFGCLRVPTLCKLLQGIQSPVDHGHLRQLYRSVNWLQPHGIRDVAQQQAWSQLQAQLHKLGPPPPMDRLPLLGNKALAALLEGLGLQYKLAVPVKGCWVDAVVEPSSDWARPALIVFEVDTRCINDPSRLTGCAALRYELLSREGVLILIPPHMAQATLDQLAHYIKPRLAFGAAGNLDVYLK